MASDLKLDTIGFTELSRVYSPEFLMKKINVEAMQLHLQEADLTRAIEQAAANTTSQIGGSEQQ